MRARVVRAAPLAARIAQFVAFKRMQGRDYADMAARLARFSAYLATAKFRGERLKPEDFERYRVSMGQLSMASQAGNLSAVRQFSLYLHAFVPEGAVVPARMVPRRSRTVRFHPLSEADVRRLMEATRILPPAGGIFAPCIRFLIGLLYSTGMRLGEALALDLGDLDDARRTLHVRRGKFRKERLVPMSPSTFHALGRWLEARALHGEQAPGSPLLLGGWNRRLNRFRAEHAFARLRIHCGFDAARPPRLHDLRHNYACRRLQLWREAGEDVDAMLPMLANALGHVDFHSTQVYLHASAAGLRQAGEKFRARFTAIRETSP